MPNQLQATMTTHETLHLPNLQNAMSMNWEGRNGTNEKPRAYPSLRPREPKNEGRNLPHPSLTRSALRHARLAQRQCGEKLMEEWMVPQQHQKQETHVTCPTHEDLKKAGSYSKDWNIHQPAVAKQQHRCGVARFASNK